MNPEGSCGIGPTAFHHSPLDTEAFLLHTAHCTIQTLRSPFSPKKKKKKSGVENKKRKTKLWVWGYLCFREDWWQGKWKVGSNAYWQGDSVLNSKLQIKVSSDEVLGRTTLETGGTHSPSPSYCPERQFSSSFLVCLYRSHNPFFRVKMPFFFFFSFGGCSGLFCHNLLRPGGS